MKTRGIRKLSGIFLVLAMLIPVLDQAQEATPTASNASDLAISSMAKSSNDFGLTLFHYLVESTSQNNNIVIAPFCISTVLGMTLMGAENNTEAQMKKVLQLSGDKEDISKGFQLIQDQLNAEADNHSLGLDMVNSIWLQNDVNFKQNFLEKLKVNFKASAWNVDFRNDHHSARLKINQWVAANTNQKIKNLIGPKLLDHKTIMVLVGAVYFKGEWKNPFDKSSTKMLPFYSSAKTSQLIPMMQKPAGYWQYTEDDEAQILEMPYKGNRFSMVLILPKTNLESIESNLTLGTLEGWIAHFKPQRLIVKLPKFKFKFFMALKKALMALGMPEAFDKAHADFSAMAILPGDENLYISKVLQKASVNVDEKGTEATAAGAVIIKFFNAVLERPSTPILFNADHPFLFLIRDKRSGTILFWGRVQNPVSDH